MRKTIFIKIFTGYVLIIALMTAGVSLLSYRIIKHQHIETRTANLETLARVACFSMQQLHARRDRAALAALVEGLGTETSTRITLIDTDGTVLADSEGRSGRDGKSRRAR